MLSINFARLGTLLGACLFAVHANASVVIATTRIVFPATQQEVTVKLSNEGTGPSLVQAWIDDGQRQAALEDLQVPFSLAPALFRLDPGKSQSLRLFHTGEALAGDRETLFWLNVLEVPPKGTGSFLQFSVRSRIKLFYRPAGLRGRPEDAHGALEWRLERAESGWVLQARNSGPYHVNLATLELQQQGQTVELEPHHVAPYSSERFRVPEGFSATAAQLHYAFIDDHGAVRQVPAIALAR